MNKKDHLLLQIAIGLALAAIVISLIVAYPVLKRENQIAEFQRKILERRNEMELKAAAEEKRQQEVFEKQQEVFWDTVDKGQHPGLLPRK